MSVQTLDCAADSMIRAPKPQRPDRDLVQSLVRALGLLEILSDRACRLTDLAQRANLPASTTHRLLTTLEQKRFVSFDRDQNLWYVGSHCYAIGSGFLRRGSLFTQAAPLLNNLASQLGTAANLGVLGGGKLILVRQSVGCDRAPVHPPGASLPLHATAMGKVLLADNQAQPELRGYLSAPLTRLTRRTICDPGELGRELRRIKREGTAMDDEESLTGRRCLAAAVRDGLGHAIAAVSITSPSSEMTDQAIPQLSAVLTTTVNQITRSIMAYERHALNEALFA